MVPDLEPLDDGCLGRYRPYLSVLARASFDVRFQAKFDPSDIVQETLLHALRDAGRAAQLTEGQRLAWLRKILANTLINTVRGFRTRKRRMELERSLEARFEKSSCALLGLLPATDSTPVKAAERNERLLQLTAALDRLPERQKKAVLLHHWEGLPVAEVAARLESTAPAVTGLLRRGLQQLRKELQDLDPAREE